MIRLQAKGSSGDDMVDDELGSIDHDAIHDQLQDLLLGLERGSVQRRLDALAEGVGAREQAQLLFPIALLARQVLAALVQVLAAGRDLLAALRQLRQGQYARLVGIEQALFLARQGLEVAIQAGQFLGRLGVLGGIVGA